MEKQIGWLKETPNATFDFAGEIDGVKVVAYGTRTKGEYKLEVKIAEESSVKVAEKGWGDKNPLEEIKLGKKITDLSPSLFGG